MRNMPENTNLRELARKLRKDSTLSEVLLWNQIKNKKLSGLDFTRQKIIGNYIVDFYCAELNFVIEIDGNSHDWKGEYDMVRHNYLVGLGLYVLHINDNSVKKDINNIVIFLRNITESISNNTTPAKDSNEWFH